MSNLPPLSVREFAGYFEALHSVRPFPWQLRLIKELVQRHAPGSQGWPDCMALPTASGKTACIDIAIFHLALQAELAPDERTAPRRVFFCVDRRVIVDEAYERALRIARRLRSARDGVLDTVARRLRRLAGDHHAAPLAVFELRGGTFRDDAWTASPLQPTIVCTTVDQLGSRLLFRGYGVSPRSAPIHAALAAHDALVLLDEAHCAEPFRQTLTAVRAFRGSRWAEQALGTPFACVELSATPRSPGAVFDLDDDDHRPKHLGRRLSTPKPAELIPTTARTESDAFKEKLVQQAEQFAKAGARRIAVMVNRVDTAIGVHKRLAEKHAGRAVLLIGRMRPLDRDDLLAVWGKTLTASADREPLDSPVFVVATQCLEVGANLDFDALVTECASLDALRQRFGRLNRLGLVPTCWAAIIASVEATRDSAADPIYSAGLHETWRWLGQHATGKDTPTIDFCADSIAALLPKVPGKRKELLSTLCPPARDAPVLLPAYLDRWCQTSPRPEPDPDVGIFLHGPERGLPTVSVCWRADLPEERHDLWHDIVSLLPPTARECMPVPLAVLHSWLSGKKRPAPDNSGDLEHATTPVAAGDDAIPPVEVQRFALPWRGADERTEATNKAEFRPGDVVVLPVRSGGWNTLGHIPGIREPDSDDPAALRAASAADRAEQATLISRRRGLLRVCDALQDRLGKVAEPLLEFARSWMGQQREDLEPLRTALRALTEKLPAGDPLRSPQAAVKILAERLADLSPKQLRRSIRSHPAGGLVLVHPHQIDLPGLPGKEDADSGDTGEDAFSAAAQVALAAHLKSVEGCAARYAAAAGLSCDLASAVAAAARLHDYGKIDPRFQALLTGRPQPVTGELLAKSTLPALRANRAGAGLPRYFRHEMLSLQIAERTTAAAEPSLNGPFDLILHLVATHHGYGRPFAPVVTDASPPDLPAFDGSPEVRTLDRANWPPSHRLDSGIGERFWTLTRRYGWWGLAYLETLVRLADRSVSRMAQEAGQ